MTLCPALRRRFGDCCRQGPEPEWRLSDRVRLSTARPYYVAPVKGSITITCTGDRPSRRDSPGALMRRLSRAPGRGLGRVDRSCGKSNLATAAPWGSRQGDGGRFR